MEVELVAHTPDPAWVIEQAASVCYDSTPTRECKLVMQCYRSGHHSVRVLLLKLAVYRVRAVTSLCAIVWRAILSAVNGIATRMDLNM